MNVVRFPAPDTWPQLVARPALDTTTLEATVREVFEAIKVGGDEALLAYTERFDSVRPTHLVATPDDFQRAEQALPAELKSAIEHAARNIRAFHRAQKRELLALETQPGVHCWRRSAPIQKVGLYAPGGTAPLFSSVLMLAVPAVEAGCPDIVLCSPPQADGAVHPAVLFAAQVAGVKTVVAAGGIQAIAAMTLGTESVPPVYKLFGPGNQYVTAAKQYAARLGVAMDMPAGPSEVAILADATANPVFVAADLLSQAEHGADSQVFFVTTDEALLEAVRTQVVAQLAELPRKELATQALAHSTAVLVRDENELLALSEAYAPEHLILHLEDARAFSERIQTAGSVFVGALTPESVGDYASGTNHTLPTAGFARAYSGVSLESFQKQITFQQLTAKGLQALGPIVETLARAERLEAHARAVSLRLATQTSNNR